MQDNMNWPEATVKIFGRGNEQYTLGNATHVKTAYT